MMMLGTVHFCYVYMNSRFHLWNVSCKNTDGLVEDQITESLLS